MLPAYFRNQKVESSRFRLEKALEIQENAASIRARTLDTEAGLDPNTDSSAESGTDLNAGPVKAERNSAASLEALAAVEAAALADVNTEMPVAMAAGNCFANEMASALPITLEQWRYDELIVPKMKFGIAFFYCHSLTYKSILRPSTVAEDFYTPVLLCL